MDDELDLLALYRDIHDGLSEMIESGRLTVEDIPDDYQWLVVRLMEAAALGHKIDQTLEAENN